MKWSQSIIAKEKHELFAKLFTFPVQTNETINDIFNEYAKLTTAQNKVITHSLSSEDYLKKFNQKIFDSNIIDFWAGEYLETLKTKSQSFVVVDKDSKGEVYYYILPISDVIDCEVKADGVCEYIIFSQSVSIEDEAAGITSRALAVDDEKFVKLVKRTNKDKYEVDGAESLHKCEKTPVFKFFPSFTGNNNINSITPISPILGGLDKLLFWNIAFDYFKLYGVFPIYWGYKKECKYFDADHNAYCQDGKITWMEVVEGTAQSNPHTIDCPACKTKQALGPGTWVDVEPPLLKEQSDLRDPVGKLDADIDSATFIEKYISNLEGKLKYAVTGKNFEGVMDKEAVNETQVQSNIETRTEVLTKIARTLEKTMYNMFYFTGKMSYGRYYSTSTVDLGRRFFLQTPDELNKEYESAKKIGKPMFELEQRQRFIQETTHQNNPDEMARVNILTELEPYQEFSFSELASLGIPERNPVDFHIKVNFNKYIRKFEQENGNIVIFGIDTDFNKKIETIKNTLTIYATQEIKEQITQIQKPKPKN